MTDDELDKLIVNLAAKSRRELRELLASIETQFPLDFSDEFLAEMPLDKLRHVVLAACLHADNPLTRCA